MRNPVVTGGGGGAQLYHAHFLGSVQHSLVFSNILIFEINQSITAFAAELNKYSIFNVPNEKLLVQEFLDGIEYVVDSISYEGTHMCVGKKK
jgi:hypothetical protein